MSDECMIDGSKSPRILVVDDLAANVDLLRVFLTKRGYQIDACASGEEALSKIDEQAPDLILLDVVMPSMNGFEVCRRLKGDPDTRHIPIIIITGCSDRESNVKGIEAGADDFLVKPFDSVLLDARIKASLKSKRLQDQLNKYQERLKNSNVLLEKRVRERTADIEHTHQITVFCMARLAESRDNETGEHIKRMREYGREIAFEMMLSKKYESVIDSRFFETLYVSLPLHDVGKVGIPDSILLKPGKLTPEEFRVMQEHATIGGDTLSAAVKESGDNTYLAMGRDIAYSHHERWDGGGYPSGLAGEDIPLSARICAVSDVYDALSSKRPYKEAFPHEKCMAIIKEGRGTQFDSDVVDAFVARESKILAIRKKRIDDGAANISKLMQLIDSSDSE